MGLPAKVLYATNTGDDREIFLSEWKPSLENGRWMMPPETPIGLAMWIPNVIMITLETNSIFITLNQNLKKTGQTE